MSDEPAAEDVRAELVALRRSLHRLERQAGVAPQAWPVAGFGLVNPGEIIAADHMNRATGQGVMRFASAAARDAAIPVGDRVDGMLAWTADTRLLWRWTAAAGAWIWRYGSYAVRATDTAISAGGGGYTVAYETYGALMANMTPLATHANGLVVAEAGVYSVRSYIQLGQGVAHTATIILQLNGSTYGKQTQDNSSATPDPSMDWAMLMPLAAGDRVGQNYYASGAVTMRNARLELVGPL